MKDYVVFILTHGRADNVVTYKTLRKRGYTGRVVFVLDNEDKQIEQYYKNYGKENCVVFDKREIAKRIDEACNWSDRRVILYARNACFDIAEQLGYTRFIELDDDYINFSYTYASESGMPEQHSINNLDGIWERMWEFYEKSGALTIAMAQRGDFVQGKYNDIVRHEKLKRKAMNSFFCDTAKRFDFCGYMNEDVNMYTTLGRMGELIVQIPQVALNQVQTQKNKGGMTEAYLDSGTYIKSFFSVMYQPSCVEIRLMGNDTKSMRLHHHIIWENCTPKILDESHRKGVQR